MQWKVGFDCATKTFAFSIGYIDVERYKLMQVNLRKQVEAAVELNKRAANNDADALHNIATIVDDLEQKTRFIVIADGGFIDLFPNRKDSSIGTVERIKAVVAYTNSRIRPAIEKIVGNEPCEIIIEFQMGPNARARAVLAALVAVFADLPVKIVSPTVKNKVYVDNAGRYSNFIESRSTTYAANKAHAKYNFSQLEKIFNSGIANTSASERGHIADSFMQIIGSEIFPASLKKEMF